MEATLGFMRRIPPKHSKAALSALLSLLPHHSSDLLSQVDQHLQWTSLQECEDECSRNCTCVAYTQLNISGAGSGCLFYHGELIDIRTIPFRGQDLHIRMASAEREGYIK